MLIVKIDRLDTQPTQAAFTRLPDIFRLPAEAADAGVVGIAHNPELGRQHHPVAIAFNRPSHQFFIKVRP